MDARSKAQSVPIPQTVEDDGATTSTITIRKFRVLIVLTGFE